MPKSEILGLRCSSRRMLLALMSLWTFLTWASSCRYRRPPHHTYNYFKAFWPTQRCILVLVCRVIKINSRSDLCNENFSWNKGMMDVEKGRKKSFSLVKCILFLFFQGSAENILFYSEIELIKLILKYFILYFIYKTFVLALFPSTWLSPFNSKQSEELVLEKSGYSP